MGDTFKLARFYFWLLAVFTIGRWALGFSGVPYEKGHHVFSLVLLTLIGAAHHAALTRAFLGRRFWPAVGLGVTLAVVTQLVILFSTAASYFAGLETYFNHPTALNVPERVGLGQALGIRAVGLLANSITGGIAAALGFLMGGALPRSGR